MLSDKEVKKEFRKKAWKSPEKYYAVDVLKEEGFERKICKKCSKPYWTASGAETCGDPECSGGFRFIGNAPVKKELSYIDVWKEFSSLFKKLGYTPIPRYPVVARWRSDTDFVQASIYDFQPYVVTGEVKPPANPLIVPQACLRFNDIDNIGITGSHFSGFVMIGQHAFMPKEKWDQNKYFRDIYTWLRKGLGLPKGEITFHEDAWAGGGNFGPSMEFFSRGLELGNQVYMMYQQTPSGNKELNLKVLDMGMGHERNAWFTNGSQTAYDASFPSVMKIMHKRTGIVPDKVLMHKFLPFASFLNVDEAENLSKAWQNIADNLKIDVSELKDKIRKVAALYSVAEHSRALLFALSDGALPSNVGGGYNLRVLLRRALTFIDKYGWDIDIHELMEAHAKYLKPIFPELSENLEEVKKILDVEKIKYENTKQKSKSVVDSMLKTKITEEKLVELYDSQGINPELVKEEAEKKGIQVKVPEDFYIKVAERHAKSEQKKMEKEGEKAVQDELPLDGIPETEALYFEDYRNVECKAKVLKIVQNFIVLDKTVFYPTSGGQVHDTGSIGGQKVVSVRKQGSVIIHELKDNPAFKEGSIVDCLVDFDRRKQLTQHHSATHIVNAAAKRVLGKHINQAGAYKDLDKARLDVTHYQSITLEEMDKIEEEANKIVRQAIPIKHYFLSRDEAEKRFGMFIYQGGAVPGKKIRIVEIPGVDVEACGGTHLNNTEEAEVIKLLKTTKIQDGIVRIVFVAGAAAKKEEAEEENLLQQTAEILGVKKDEVPARAKELFEKWKTARKAIKKGRKIEAEDLELNVLMSENLEDEDLLRRTAEIFKTQPEHVPKTAKRFLRELDEMRDKIRQL